MDNITKMFIHYNHTKADFIAAGLESKYTNSIVFISGAGSETPCIYTHNNYYGNVQDALDALAQLSYIKGVKVGDKTFTAPANGEGAVIPFASADPATIEIDATAGTITFGLNKDFKKKIDNTATNLGERGTYGTAFAEIARLEDLIKALTGSGEGTIDEMIKAQINALDASIDSSVVNGFKVSVYENDGKITKVDVTAPDVDGKISDAIGDLDSSAKDSSNGFGVYVELKDGKLLPDGVGVKVTAPDVSTIVVDKISDAIALLDSEKEDTDNGIYVKVTEVDGKITAVDVSANDLVKNYKEDISDAIKALDSSKEGSNNGIYVKVTEVDGLITAVDVDASGMTKKADLDATGKILADQLPDYILGQVLFGGTIDGSGKVTTSDSYKAKYGDTTVVPDASTAEGAYFIATGSGELSGIDYTPTTLEYTTGDWIISTGTEWVKIDNTDAVSSVAGLTGAITASALAAELSKDGIANELALKSEVDAAIEALDSSAKDSSNGFSVYVELKDGKLLPDGVGVKVTAPNIDGKISDAIADLDSSAEDTDNGIYVKVTEEDGKITAVDVSAANVAQKTDITAAIEDLDSSATGTDKGFSVYVELKDGKLLPDNVGVKVNAPDIDGKIDTAIKALDSSAEGSNNGVKVYVEQTDGKLSKVDVQTTIADTSVANSTGLVNNDGLQFMFKWVEL